MTGRVPIMLIWAARENLRRPGSNLLLAVCLTGLTLCLSLVLLLSASLERTSARLLDLAPDLVVRRLGPGGWQPMPTDVALQAVHDLPGVNRARARVWGLVQSGAQSVTAVVADEADLAAAGSTPPRPGHAIAGGWWRPRTQADPMVLAGLDTVTLKVDAVLPPSTDMAAFDTVILNLADARRLLGLSADGASDLALYVFHPEEAEALRPELHEAFPWPVTIRTRTETLEWYRGGFGRRSSLVVLLWLPAVIGLGLMVLAVVQRQWGTRFAAGLLKALGWTTGDILRLKLYQALIIALPSIILGLSLSYVLTSGPFTPALARVMLGWPEGGPSRTLAPGAHLWVFFGVAALVLLPYLAAVIGPALQTAAAVPDELLNKET
ncbi:MAG: hypothetical protein QNJ04_09165 [Desulfobacterales bacterium]|nr:hypothetical protein [Desulfobacterales bacterium]